MRTLDKMIERYKVSDTNDGLGTILWGGKSFYKLNSTKPIILNRRTGGFILDENQKAVEIGVSFDTIEGDTLDQYYPHPYFDNKEFYGFKITQNLPNFKKGEVYLIQQGIEGGDYISGAKYKSIYFVSDCLDYPEFFQPQYRDSE